MYVLIIAGAAVAVDEPVAPYWNETAGEWRCRNANHPDPERTGVVMMRGEYDAIVAAAVRHYDGVVQGRLDGAAQAFGYGDPNRPEVSPILHVVSYADEPAVVKFQAEGRVFRAFRSRTWAHCAGILDAVVKNQRPAPTDEELLAELDVAVPVPTEADVLAEIARLTT